MNIFQKLTTSTLLMVMTVFAHPAHATGQVAGLTCVNPPGTLQFGVGSDTMDDVLACVSGTWHSMIYDKSMPTGAVEAFNLSTCPSGWIEAPGLAGRTIIGAGTGNGLTPHPLNDNGGEEMHTMTLNELVPHTIIMPFGASDKGGRGNGYAFSDNAGGSTMLAIYNKASYPVGGGQPFNVMMPYYALLYCIKQ